MGENPPAYDQNYPPQQGYPPPQETQPQCYPPPQGAQPQCYPPPQGVPPQGAPQQGYPQQPTTVIVQPNVLIGGMVHFGQFPQNIVCPNCQANVITSMEYVIGTLTWLIAAILFIIGCGLCCWIPCVVDGCKDIVHKCPSCHNVVGQYTRM